MFVSMFIHIKLPGKNLQTNFDNTYNVDNSKIRGGMKYTFTD
jgi:hypothetical protein